MPKLFPAAVMGSIFLIACGNDEKQIDAPAPVVPNRVKVTATVASDAPSTKREIGVGGGEVGLRIGDDRITLIFPRDALTKNTDITMTAVKADVPFQTPVAAVHVTPEDALLRYPPSLRLETKTAIDAGRSVVGFAIRDGEMHLVPAVSSFEMHPNTLGTFGFVAASPSEIAAAAKRLPADPLSRLEQQIAVAFAPRPQAAVPIAFMQIAPQPLSPPPSHPAWLQELLESIRDAYEDVVLPAFANIPKDDCLSPALWKAIETYCRWDALNQLLLQVEPDPHLLQYRNYRAHYHSLVRQRHQMLRDRGFTEEQIADINQHLEKYRQSFTEISRRMAEMIVRELRNAFASVHRCCMTQQPMTTHPETLIQILRSAALFGIENLVPDAGTKVQECTCRVRAASKGSPEAFYGTITQYELLDVSEEETSGGGGRMKRTTKRTRNLEYSLTLNVLRPFRGNNMFAEASATAREDLWTLLSDDYGSCVNEVETRKTIDGRAEDAQVIAIHLRPKDRQFNISYSAIPVEASGPHRDRRHMSGSGCNVFQVKRNRDTTSWRDGGIGGSNVDVVDAEFDPASPFLRGSKTMKGMNRNGDRTDVTVKWDLRRCGQ